MFRVIRSDFIIVGLKSRTRSNFPPLTNCSSFPIARTSIVMRGHNAKRALGRCHNLRLLYILWLALTGAYSPLTSSTTHLQTPKMAFKVNFHCGHLYGKQLISS